MCLYPKKIKIKTKNKNITNEYDVYYGEFGYNPTTLDPLIDEYYITVPCGKCIECAKQISNEWAFRICDEARMYEQNCCLTLTYDNEHLPTGGLLSKRDHQLFLKRFRKAIAPRRIRYFLSGEYGSLRGRPHYHVIVFGYYPPDCVYKFTRNGRDFYTSEFISSVWQNGQILVGELDMHTAFYTAKYLQKAIDFGKEVKPYVCMSRRPGIGGELSYSSLKTDKLYFDGRFIKLPRYYLNRYDKAGYSVYVEDIKAARKRAAERKEAQIRHDPDTYFKDLALKQERAREMFAKLYRSKSRSTSSSSDTP